MRHSLPNPTSAPLLLPPELRLTPEQFAAVGRTNPEAELELGSDGQLITTTPTGGETGARNQALARCSGRPSARSSAAAFPPLPDLVVELASPSDDLSALRCKLESYRTNGASLGLG
ncbi:Uma2 family endonuclease [Cyanobium sp. Morenito 9A2]|uniref:Uma2 family endonuclease n=1 Tax=Cyanobium sp. Morenito 9A2 TaxID=2823718 RepID=UPI0020CF6FE8|nr:Uma2 family endonuclease [Cyanobium sp. Morenito 9A2]